MSNLIKRTLSGIVLVAVLLGSLCNEISFTLIFTLITALCVWEFCTLANKRNDVCVNRFITTLSGTYLCLVMALYSLQLVTASAFAVYILMLVYLLVTELYLQHPNPMNNWAYAFAAQLYIALPLSLVFVIAFRQEISPFSSGLVFHNEFPLALLVFLWLNDTGAYVVGSTLQRFWTLKLFPRISPNKSWIGSIGGAVFVGIAAAVFSHFYHTLTLMQWLGMGAVVVVFGTWGDLVESLIKRQLGVKDSGRFLPGHGGVLDRFDSLILATPATAVYLYLIHQI